jgi:hypothetical protein
MENPLCFSIAQRALLLGGKNLAVAAHKIAAASTKTIAALPRSLSPSLSLYHDVSFQAL